MVYVLLTPETYYTSTWYQFANFSLWVDFIFVQKLLSILTATPTIYVTYCQYLGHLKLNNNLLCLIFSKQRFHNLSNKFLKLQLYNNFWLGFCKSQAPVENFFVISGFLTYTLIENRLRSGKPLKFLFLLTYRLIRYL